LLQIKRGVFVLVACATIALLAWAQLFFIPLAFAMLLTLTLNPLVSRLRRIGVPRELGAALLLLTLVALVALVVLSLQDDALELLKQLPASMRHFRHMLQEAASDRSGWWQRLDLVARSARDSPGANSATLPPAPTAGVAFGTTLLSGTLGAVVLVGQLIVVLFLVYFLLVIRLPASGATRTVARDILAATAHQVQLFVGVLVLTNILLGLLTWLAFSLLGVGHAAVWGLAAGVLHFIPYAGPAAVAGAAALAATVQFESLGSGALVALVSLGLSTIVGVGITTWLTGRSVRMNAAAMFVGLLFWGWMWGMPGLLLGAPLMMTLKVFADRLPALHWLARLLAREPG
jgi:predicted PurR-regulated permease PerM